MGIVEVQDKYAWDGFLLAQPTQVGIFLQSWQWGEFQTRLGRKVWRLGITRTDTNRKTNGHELVGVCGIVRHNLPFDRSCLYAPRGPVLDHGAWSMKHRAWDGLMDYVRRIAQKERAIFWKIEPPEAPGAAVNEFWRSSKFVSTDPVQPRQTLIVDLTRSKDELLAGMHEKTRYNIRLADRKGIKVKTGEFDEFWSLLCATARRDGFRTHPRRYYEIMLKSLSGERTQMRVRLHTAYLNKTPLAGAIVGYFGDTATYLHGASDYAHRALMAPYALHWSIMQIAKQNGCKFYDFWGIQLGAKGQGLGARNWEGMTRFKMGFGGTVVDYPGAFDLPLRKFWYTLYRFGRKVLP